MRTFYSQPLNDMHKKTKFDFFNCNCYNNTRKGQGQIFQFTEDNKTCCTNLMMLLKMWTVQRSYNYLWLGQTPTFSFMIKSRKRENLMS